MSRVVLPTVCTVEETPRKGERFDLSQPRIQFILRHLGNDNDVLDVGCFVGHYSNAFAAAGNRVVGIDVDAEVVNHARSLHPHLKFEQVDAMKIAVHFGHQAFDVVVAGEVIEHVLNPQLFVENVLNVLMPGGEFILTTQNSNAIQFRLRMLVGRFRWDPTHFRLYSREGVVREVRRGGFEVVRVQMLPIAPKGRSQFARLCTYYAGRLYPNWAWTTAVVARKPLDT